MGLRCARNNINDTTAAERVRVLGNFCTTATTNITVFFFFFYTYAARIVILLCIIIYYRNSITLGFFFHIFFFLCNRVNRPVTVRYEILRARQCTKPAAWRTAFEATVMVRFVLCLLTDRANVAIKIHNLLRK